MKYMLLICPDRTVELSEEEESRISPDAQAWVAEMEGRGVRLRGQELATVEDATTIRLRHGELVVADGPFAETKEQISTRRSRWPLSTRWPGSARSRCGPSTTRRPEEDACATC
jgi:hypothetical protein